MMPLGAQLSPLRRHLLAYAKGHNGRINLRLLETLGPYRREAVRNMLFLMTREGSLVRIRWGVYELRQEIQ